MSEKSLSFICVITVIVLFVLGLLLTSYICSLYESNTHYFFEMVIYWVFSVMAVAAATSIGHFTMFAFVLIFVVTFFAFSLVLRFF